MATQIQTLISRSHWRCCFSSNSRTASSLPMEMLKYRASYHFPGTCLPRSPGGNVANYAKTSQLRPRKLKELTMSPSNDNVLRSLTHVPRCAMTGFSYFIPLPIISGCSSLGHGMNMNLPYYGALTKKMSSVSSTVKSQVPRAMERDEKKVLGGGRSAGNYFFKQVLKKNSKLSKPLATHGKNSDSVSEVVSDQDSKASSSASKLSSLEDTNIRNPAEQLARDDKSATDLGPSTSTTNSSPQSSIDKLEQKKKSRRKQNEERTSGADASPDDVKVKASKQESQATKLKAKKAGGSSEALENSSTKTKPMDVPESSVSAKPKSKKASRKSKGAGKSVSSAKVLKSNESANQDSSRNELPEKKKSEVRGRSKPLGEKALRSLYPPVGKSVVVVESVTKAKVIQGYLGENFEVLPSYGHVRDLAGRSGSVRPDDNFSMVWEVPTAAWTHLKSIKVALSGSENLILASDPDREGEAIAWHIVEMLQQQDALDDKINIARVVFHEITESSIKSALQAPRHIDINLVHAYLARRALDYLIGFNISPLLWRKLPGCQSAGRVQSAALALICDREMEIDEFKPQEYWTIEAKFNSKDPSGNTSLISAHLTHSDNKKLNQFSISSQTEAKVIEEEINSSNFKVVGNKSNKMRKNPPPPYITSTLQQDAANKLHFPAAYTMMLAQKLYEGVQLSDDKAAGLITYMRTDGLHVSDEAAQDIRSLVIERYGQDFTSEGARKYFKKVKNAQESHEAIRPTDIQRFPSMLKGVLDEDSLRLYTLIWSRTMACQMEPATVNQIQVDIANAGESIVFRSTCSRVAFPGYLAVYEDAEVETMKCNQIEEDHHEQAFAILSMLKPGDPLNIERAELNQHHTQPPPRYSEGSLVKKLEELGIGRPSTYATTMKVLQDRNYVTVKSRVLYPEFRGRMVSAFLCHYFSEVTDYSFTADMESELDNVSGGLTEWKGLLKDYWTRFSSYCSRASNVHIHQVEKMLEKTFEDFLFASIPDKSRTCPSCMQGTLIFKVSRFGAGYFIGCDQHPKCKYIAKTLYGDEEEEVTPSNNKMTEEPKLLGLHPSSNEKIFLKNGPYGYYVQLGEDRKGHLPKRAALSQLQIKDVGSVTLKDAIELLRYPLTLGNHPEDGLPVIIKLSKFGFTVRHRRTIAPVPKNLKPDNITLEKAMVLLSSKHAKKCGRPKNKPKSEEVYEAI